MIHPNKKQNNVGDNKPQKASCCPVERSVKLVNAVFKVFYSSFRCFVSCRKKRATMKYPLYVQCDDVNLILALCSSILCVTFFCSCHCISIFYIWRRLVDVHHKFLFHFFDVTYLVFFLIFQESNLKNKRQRKRVQTMNMCDRAPSQCAQ